VRTARKAAPSSTPAASRPVRQARTGQVGGFGAVGDAHDRAARLLVGLGPLDPDPQSLPRLDHIAHVERCQLRAPQRASEADQQHRPVPRSISADPGGRTNAATTTSVTAASLARGAAPWVRRMPS
jgi:hypothetical protein